jgi:hypothetical protein
MLLIFCGADFLLTGDGKALRALILVIHEFIIIFCGAGFISIVWQFTGILQGENDSQES